MESKPITKAAVRQIVREGRHNDELGRPDVKKIAACFVADPEPRHIARVYRLIPKDSIMIWDVPGG